MNEKEDRLALVNNDAWEYNASQKTLNKSRQQLFDSIRSARQSNATQQEIADATVAGGEDGLSRQRIAQIIGGV